MMEYQLFKDVIDLVWQYKVENDANAKEKISIEGFKNWMFLTYNAELIGVEPDWEGKGNGRSPDSTINTLLVHMNRFARSYAKSAIFGSNFSTQEDFIYLINLKAFGEMSKIELIKKNIQEKPVGMQIINRLIEQKWVLQKDSVTDRRSKVISITNEGLEALENQMKKIRQATAIVAGKLTHPEKMELIRILTKLSDFHQLIYEKNIDSENLIEEALKELEK